MIAKTIAELKRDQYPFKTIRTEIRDNLIKKIKSKEHRFSRIYGYDKTVIPDTERALLSGHNILFLGLRGQAKTRIARLMVDFLDEYIPIVAGSEINDHPYAPVSIYARQKIQELGEQTPIEWIHRSTRYVEKLATPDVSIADLIGDLDPIKAAHQKLSFADERSLHYGLIPRSNRSIFVINELPDLQARIQVSLFNILEEEDLQIRGYKIKLPLDVFFVFTANPEDYTHRGSIITPLKDRIESQILTHYPIELEDAMKITDSEAKINSDHKSQIIIPELILRIIDQIAFIARESEFVDEKSGVSARLSIAARELLQSAVEHRMLINGEKKAQARILDLLSVVPALTGKLELVYEGEQQGSLEVALHLINEAISAEIKPLFVTYSNGKKKINESYTAVVNWFSNGNSLELDTDIPENVYTKTVESAISDASLLLVCQEKNTKLSKLLLKEALLHFLSAQNAIQKEWYDQRIEFKDPLSSMLEDLNLSEN
ncbi:MAG: sigma 54-interacting transcriptional regulator [Bacteroidota bacterium]|nr:sigma 54-interacting transcriptional regulator [Bacteroidota bacterium]